MRSANLAKAALRAEILRYKYMAARQGKRAAFGMVGVVFAIGCLISLEIALWQIAAMYVLPIYATLIVLGINLVIAAVFGILAMRSSPGQGEIDALDVRNTAVTALQRSLAFGALVPVAASLWRRRGNTQRPLAKRASRR